MPRNRELMRVFRDMELVEQIGSGMSRILKVYDRSIFELTPSFTVVTFPFEKAFILSNDKINDKISKKKKKTLDVIKGNPSVTIAEISRLTNRSQSTISRELKRYQSAGVLRRYGARKSGRWIVF